QAPRVCCLRAAADPACLLAPRWLLAPLGWVKCQTGCCGGAMGGGGRGAPGGGAGGGRGPRGAPGPGGAARADTGAGGARLDGAIVTTPLVPFPGVEPRLLIKPECLQPVGSFKLRGAYSAISALPEQARRRGVVAHSSGNHAQAIAYAAALLGVPATVV